LLFGAELGGLAEQLRGDLIGLGVRSACLGSPAPNGWSSIDDEVAGQSALPPSASLRAGIGRTDALCYTFATGGTGSPKAIVVHHSKFCNAGQLGLWLGVGPRDVIYGSGIPLSQPAAGVVGIGWTMTTGCVYVIRRRFSASAWLDDVVTSGASVVQHGGELARYILATPQDPGDAENLLRLSFGCGLRHEHWRRFQLRFGIASVVDFNKSGAEASSPSAACDWSLGPGAARVEHLEEDALLPSRGQEAAAKLRAPRGEAGPCTADAPAPEEEDEEEEVAQLAGLVPPVEETAAGASEAEAPEASGAAADGSQCPASSPLAMVTLEEAETAAEAVAEAAAEFAAAGFGFSDFEEAETAAEAVAEAAAEFAAAEFAAAGFGFSDCALAELTAAETAPPAQAEPFELAEEASVAQESKGTPTNLDRNLSATQAVALTEQSMVAVKQTLMALKAHASGGADGGTNTHGDGGITRSSLLAIPTPGRRRLPGKAQRAEALPPPAGEPGPVAPPWATRPELAWRGASGLANGGLATIVCEEEESSPRGRRLVRSTRTLPALARAGFAKAAPGSPRAGLSPAKAKEGELPGLLKYPVELREWLQEVEQFRGELTAAAEFSESVAGGPRTSEEVPFCQEGTACRAACATCTLQ